MIVNNFFNKMIQIHMHVHHHYIIMTNEWTFSNVLMPTGNVFRTIVFCILDRGFNRLPSRLKKNSIEFLFSYCFSDYEKMIIIRRFRRSVSSLCMIWLYILTCATCLCCVHYVWCATGDVCTSRYLCPRREIIIASKS